MLDAIVTAGYLALVTGRTQVSVRDLVEAMRLQLRLGDPILPAMSERGGLP